MELRVVFSYISMIIVIGVVLDGLKERLIAELPAARRAAEQSPVPIEN